MKRKALNILTISSIITSFLYIMDGDVVKPNISMRFTEFFGMMGIIFLAISTISLLYSFALKKIRKA